MKTYTKPILVGKTGEKKFILNDGTETKTFYDVGKYNKYSKVWPILDDENNEIEYMDLLGNFDKQKSDYAYQIGLYLDSFGVYPIARSGKFKFYTSALSNFPSIYLVDEKTRNFILKEENSRLEFYIKTRFTLTFIETIGYKKFIKNLIKQKLKEVKEFKNQEEFEKYLIDVSGL